MSWQQRWIKRLGVAMMAFGACTSSRATQPKSSSSTRPAPTAPSLAVFGRLEMLTPAMRDGLRGALQKPTLAVRGPLEVFRGQPLLYRWFVDNPDQAVEAWRRLGAKCTDVHRLGPGRFSWTDGHGGEIHWWTVHTGPHDRIWYAEGHARPGPLLPLFSVRAVVVLRFDDDMDVTGQSIIRHQMDVFAQTDSRTAAIVTRLLGSAVPRLAENGVTQMEMFYSALVWFLEPRTRGPASLNEDNPTSNEKASDNP